MSTAIATGIEKSKVMELLRGAGSCSIAFSTDEEFIYMSLDKNGHEHWLVVGEYGGRDVNGTVKSSSLRLALKRGKRDATVEFGYAEDGIAVKIDGDRERTVTTTGHVNRSGPFQNIEEHQATIPHDAVNAASTIDWANDAGSQRFAMGTVRFESGYAVATDGRRMNVLDLGLDMNLLATVPVSVVAFASKFGQDVSRHKSGAASESQGGYVTEYVIAGELICEFSGRYPDWKSILPENTDTAKTFDTKDLLRRCEDRIDANDNADEDAEEGLKVDIGDTTVSLDPKYLAEVVRKMKFKSLAMQTTFATPDDNRSGQPVLITSDDDANWQQILMPRSDN